MSKITALKPAKNKANRVNLYLDGKYAFSVEQAKVHQEGLDIGLELSVDRLETLKQSLKISRCINAADRLLSFRPRSEAELRERLKKRGFPTEHIEIVILKLKEQHLLDDSKFAEFWSENRETFKPRSRWLTGRELAQKGVDAEVINQVISGIDEDESAYQAALPRAHRFAAFEHDEFRRKMGAYLQRRGFNYSVINRAVKKVWEEIKRKE
jgi:regulatory protein